MHPDRSRQSSSRGFALVVVLWTLGPLALIGAELTISGRVQTHLAAAARDEAMAEAAADGAIRHAMFVIGAGTESRESLSFRFSIGNALVDIAAEDEAAKLDPNASTVDELRGLLRAVGVDPPRAAALAAAIVDWRSRSTISVSGGLKANQYRAAGMPYREADRPFESLDEIALVLGMTDEIAARLRPWLSLYREGKVGAVGEASPVSAALGDAAISARGGDRPNFVTSTRVFRLTATASVRGQARFTRSAVVRLRAEPANGGEMFQILNWE
jgi:general secretion pathway protein K